LLLTNIVCVAYNDFEQYAYPESLSEQDHTIVLEHFGHKNTPDFCLVSVLKGLRI
jgi:hypothetical protein